MRNVWQWTCWCLLVVFPSTLLAADVENAAMLSGSGTVRINGVISPRSSTVLAGDKVVTAKDSTAMLTSKGRIVILPENSSVAYDGKRVRLEYGRVLIHAQPGTEAQLGNLTVSPAQTGARLEMRRSGNKMVLVAQAGSLHLTDGVHSMTLASGQTLVTASPQEQSGGAGAGGAAGGTAPAAALTTGISLTGWVIAGAVVAAGTLGGLAAAGVLWNHGGPASPSVP